MRVLLTYQKGPERDSISLKVTERIGVGLGLELQVSYAQSGRALCAPGCLKSKGSPLPAPSPAQRLHWGSVLLLSFLPHQPLWGPGGPPPTRPLPVLSAVLRSFWSAHP